MVLLSGCGRAVPKEKIPFPEGMFRLSIEPILVDDWNVIYSVKVQTRGEQWASLWEGQEAEPEMRGGIKTFTGVHGPNRDSTSLAQAEYLIVATLVTPGDEPGYLQYAAKGRAGGFSGGGNSLFPLIEETELEDEISIRELNGDFPEREPIEIGRFRDEKIMLSIEAPPEPKVRNVSSQEGKPEETP